MIADPIHSSRKDAVGGFPGFIASGRGFLIRLIARLVLLLIGGQLLTGMAGAAEERAFPEYQLKAALLYQFAKFTTWPSNSFASPTAPIRVGIVGIDPFGPFLSGMVQGKSIAGRTLTLVAKEADDDLSDCHILFISGSEKERFPPILDSVRHKPILTISELDRFAQSGGMVRFIRVGENIRFELNVQATEASHLQISSILGAFGILVKSGSGKR